MTKSKLALWTLAAWTVASGAQAQTRSGLGGGWVNFPTAAEFDAAAPPAARTGQGGRAVVRCHVEDTGELSGCTVIRETPSGQGYGPALMSLAPKHRRAAPGPKDMRDLNIVADWFNVDGPSDWQRRPTAEQLLAVYPGAAKGAAGRANINCIVTVQGALTDCVVMGEQPVGLGFGEAAIALTAQFTMKPVKWRGAPALTTVSIPINWEAGASANQPGSRRVVPANLAWAEAPTFADIAAAYPKKAREEKRGGRAALSCDMSEEGRLVRCSEGATDPPGYGFDNAAKALSKKFRFVVTTEADKKATHKIVVHLPVTFDPATLDVATPVVGKPSWAVLPNESQLAGAFGRLGLTQTARVVLNCLVQAGGGLADCNVVSEQPAGAGVGAAALGLLPSFRVTTWTADGLPVVGGRIGIPIRYEPPATPPAAPK